MARFLFRAHGPTDSQPLQASLKVAALALSSALASCVAYKPAPIDVSQVLTDLDARQWQWPTSPDGEQAEGAHPRQLASFAISHNPSLQAVRARIGVSQALLVEAGLFSDPEGSWDGMDALAAWHLEGNATRVDVLAGFGLSIPLPRPGELSAKKGAARWHVREERLRVTQAEWALTRDVYVACEDLLEADALLEQNEFLMDVAEKTGGYFERAKEAGAATAIQANLALGDLLAIRAQRLRLEGRQRDARHRLNGLLGLPPSVAIPLVAAGEPNEVLGQELEVEPEALVASALDLRPDLAALLAAYGVAEEEVHLEVARQFPAMTIGTGIGLVPGIFTRFNRPAIRTALARRDVLRGEVEAQVHEVRRDIFDAAQALDESLRELQFLETLLLPNAEESLRLAGQAFDAGEVTLLEILTLQRALVDAHTRTTETRAEVRRRHWQLLSASGTLLATAAGPTLSDDDPQNPVR